MIRHMTTAIVVVGLAILVAGGDTLYLRDGEQEAGRLVKMSGGKLWFETSDGVRPFGKPEVLKVQLQQKRLFDDIESAEQITDPDLRRCIETQPSPEAFPSAGYVILFERLHLDLTEPGVVAVTTRMIVKVMQQRGEDIASQNVYYFEDMDTPRIDFALTVTPDGRVLHLSDAAIKNESIYAQLPDYRRLARYRFACKEPRPGSILDFQYTVHQKRTGFLEPLCLQTLFGADQPLLAKEVEVKVPAGEPRAVQAVLTNGGDAVTHSERSGGGGDVLTWTLAGPRQAIMPEPYMPPMATVVPCLTLTSRATWGDLARSYAQAIEAVPPIDNQLVSRFCEGIPEDVKAAETIYSVVTRGIRTAPAGQLHYSLVPRSGSETSRRGLANELDKNFLYYQLLKARGVECAFALVRSRSLGPFPEEAPSLKAFDRSAVRLADGTFVSASSDVLPFGALPGSMQGALALVFDGEAALTTVPRATPADECEESVFTGTLDGEGTLALQLTFSGDNNAGTWLRELKDLDEQKLANRLRQMASWIHPGAALTTYTVTDLADLAVPPAITLSVRIPGYATAAGDDLLLFAIPALFYDAADVGRPSREHDLFWPRVARETVLGRITFPEGFVIHSLPEPASFESSSVVYQAQFIPETDGLRFEDCYELRVDEAPASAYAEYKTCRELRARLAQQRVILTRKAP